MIGLHKDKVDLHPYDKNWKAEYEKEAKILHRILKDYALDIQHVGSTAIPGLSAKPIIDIAVAVKDIPTLRILLPQMSKHGYDMLDSIDAKGEVLARKGSPENRTHYIHIEVLGSDYWNNHIWFRDYLLKYPEYITQYETLKQEVAASYKNERIKYTASKNEFIQGVLSKAKIEFDKKF